MIYISHRGNIFGLNKTKENDPTYIQDCLDFGYDCEIDVHYINSCFFLGHNIPEYKINLSWLESRSSKLWIHCKNLESIVEFNQLDNFNYFWHEKDRVTLTSKGYIWAYPGNQPIKNSIAVIPEKYNEKITSCIGICSDYLNEYKFGILGS